MDEIEILVEVFDDISTVTKKLDSIAAFSGMQKVHDIYFFNPNDDLLKPSEELRLSNSLRVRKKNDFSYLTFKKDHFNGDQWLYSDEHETKVEDFGIAVSILKGLGYQTLVEIINTKRAYLYKDYEIVVEDVENLGLYLEIEYIGEIKRTVEDIKAEINDIIKLINMNVSIELNSGKPELMIKKMNKADGKKED